VHYTLWLSVSGTLSRICGVDESQPGCVSCVKYAPLAEKKTSVWNLTERSPSVAGRG
jgi:hypothetical protein